MHNDIYLDGFEKLNKIEQYCVIAICFMFILLTLLLAMSIFMAFNEKHTWVHLLLLPQLFGIMFGLFKLRKLSQ